MPVYSIPAVGANNNSVTQELNLLPEFDANFNPRDERQPDLDSIAPPATGSFSHWQDLLEAAQRRDPSALAALPRAVKKFIEIDLDFHINAQMLRGTRVEKKERISNLLLVAECIQNLVERAIIACPAPRGEVLYFSSGTNIVRTDDEEREGKENYRFFFETPARQHAHNVKQSIELQLRDRAATTGKQICDEAKFRADGIAARCKRTPGLTQDTLYTGPANPAKLEAFTQEILVDAQALAPGYIPNKKWGTIGFIRRAAGGRFWRTKIRRAVEDDSTSIARKFGNWNIHGNAKASSEGAERAFFFAQCTQAWAQNTWMTHESEVGRGFVIEKAIESSISNPAIFLAEANIRSIGITKYALQRGFKPIFITASCPSKFHPLATIRAHNNAKKRRINNKKYDDRLSINDSARHLCKQWHEATKEIGRGGTEYEYIRCLEPHDSGVTHLHSVLFIAPEYFERVEHNIREYFLNRFDALEPGAQEHRVNFKYPAPGESDSEQVTRYILKTLQYLTKNIKAVLENEQTIEVSARDHASAHAYRMFQTSETNIGLWRMLRACKDPRMIPADILESWRNAHGFTQNQYQQNSFNDTLSRERMIELVRDDDAAASVAPEHFLNFLNDPARTRWASADEILDEENDYGDKKIRRGKSLWHKEDLPPSLTQSFDAGRGMRQLMKLCTPAPARLIESWGPDDDYEEIDFETQSDEPDAPRAIYRQHQVYVSKLAHAFWAIDDKASESLRRGAQIANEIFEVASEQIREARALGLHTIEELKDYAQSAVSTLTHRVAAIVRELFGFDPTADRSAQALAFDSDLCEQHGQLFIEHQVRLRRVACDLENLINSDLRPPLSPPPDPISV